MEYATRSKERILNGNTTQLSVQKETTLFSTMISTGAFDEFIDSILKLPEMKTSSYVCFANVHMITECYRDKELCEAVNHADVIAPDGKPVSWFLNTFQGRRQVKVSGPDIFPELLKQAARRGKKVFFYGSTNKVLKKVVARALFEFPALQIAGAYSPAFIALTEDEKNTIADMINKAGPHLVFVALGCPKQEKWMAENAGKISACMLGIGQAFQVYAEELKRAPKQIQDLGFEWAYRLSIEPNRLWKRYLRRTHSFFS